MIFEDVTIQDCQREALLETQVVLAQRKINRLFKQIETKEEIAQRVTSQWFCEHYDSEIGIRYQEIAQLEGAVRAAKLELDRLADKRYAEKARRLAALALIEEVGKKATTGTTTPPSAPSSDPRQKQQSMFFGPGAPPSAPAKSASPSVTVDQKAEDDIARAFEICSREIPPPDPTPTASTPAAAASSGMPAAAPLTRPTLARTVTAPEIAGSVGQADMAVDNAVPANKEVSDLADGPATSMAAPATADAKDSATDRPTQAAAPSDGAGSERAEGDGPSGMNYPESTSKPAV